MKFCILGPSCFGINLAHYLQSRGHGVFGIGRSKPKSEAFTLGLEWEYHAHHLTYEIEPVVHLIRQRQPDFIVNFAAQGESGYSWNSDNWRYYETNSMGLARLVSMVECGRFVQVGSSEVYGPTEAPALEGQLLNPTSPYSISKAAFDLHLQAMRGKVVPFNIIRPSNCYTPGQQLHRIIPKTLLYGLTGKRLQLQGGGIQKKSFLHADDLSKAILLICEKGLPGEIYNVGPEEPVSIARIVAICSQVMGMSYKDLIEEVPARHGEDKQYWLNSEKVKSLGWREETSLMGGIQGMREWVEKYLPQLSQLPTDFQMKP
jgi:dTDP-glucose 4,6-dehydratase